jgi:hypothetical protein
MGGSHTSADVDMMCTYESDEEQMQIYRVVNRQNACNRGTTFAVFENVYGRWYSCDECWITSNCQSFFGSYQRLDTDPTTIKVTTRRGSYRRYTEDQVEKLYDLVIKKESRKTASLTTGINIRTTQHYIKSYNDYEETRLPKIYTRRYEAKPVWGIRRNVYINFGIT